MKIAHVLRALVASFIVGAASSLFAAVSSTTAWVQYVLASNPQTLPTTFVFQNSTDLLVLDTRTPANPVTLTLNSDYTVTGGAGSTGNVITISGGTHGVQVGDIITVTRGVPLTQTTNYTNSGPLTAAMIGSSFDKLTMIAQQLNLMGARSLQFPADETRSGVLSLTDRKSNLLGFDSSGNIHWYASPGTGNVGTVTSVATSGGLTGGPITTSGTISIDDTAVTPGAYTSANITVDQKGRITAAANGGGVSSITASTGITLTPNPIIATGTIKITDTAVTPGSYTSANITVDQQGRITASASGGANVQVFTSTNTWTKPTNAKTVFVYIIGGGAGGGSGRRGASGAYRGGGGGGAGGGAFFGMFPASILGAFETVGVGGGGSGGAAVTADNTDGNAGSIGSNSSFGSWCFGLASPTGQGAGGTTTDAAGGSTVTTMVYPGGAGGNAGTTAATPAAAFGGGGGGGGASLNTSNLFVSAGTGGSGGVYFGVPTNGGAGATTNSGAGTVGTAAAASNGKGGGGGGGGGGGPAGVGGIGGAGGNYGGGGAGGGASANGNNSGAGGAGAPGIALIISVP